MAISTNIKLKKVIELSKATKALRKVFEDTEALYLKEIRNTQTKLLGRTIYVYNDSWIIKGFIDRGDGQLLIELNAKNNKYNPNCVFDARSVLGSMRLK